MLGVTSDTRLAGRAPRPRCDELLGLYAGRSVVVTGGRGFIGSAVVGLLADADCRIVRVSREERAPSAQSGRALIEDVTGDIRETRVWERVLADADVVFHLAAQTSVVEASENPAAVFEVNVRPLLRLLETCRRTGLRRTVVFAGTATQVGVPSRLPVDETHEDEPLTTYDAHKLVAERHLENHVRDGVVAGTTLRLANVYGPGPPSSSAGRGVLNAMIRTALRGETLTVYGRGDFVRDYVYVGDVARAFLMAGARGEAVNGQHFVIGSDHGHTIDEAFRLVASRVALSTGTEVRIRHITPDRVLSPVETRSFVADSSRFRRATGWRAECSLPEGIDHTIEAYLCASS